MAGGPNTPALAAAVANSGGVGSFGFAYSSAQKIAEDLAATKRLTQGPLNANFFVFRDVALPDVFTQAAALSALQQLPGCESLALSIPDAPFFPDINQMLEPVWDHRPALLTFHFGLPARAWLLRAHSLGITVGVTATSVQEARQIEDCGADFVIAQGIEAGGHRGIFDPGGADDNLAVPELVRQIRHAISVPVIAAGGIMDGDGIHRMIAAGASAAQLGTAFLACDESGASAAHKRFLLSEHARGTAYTRAFSGRRAQGIHNAFMRSMEGKPHLPFPIQNTLTAALRQAAGRRDDGEYQSLWAGSAYADTRAMPAAQLMQALGQEYFNASGKHVPAIL